MTKKHFKYIAILLLSCASGCTGSKTEQELMKWHISLDRKDKQPYGTYLAYESLKYYFPEAVTEQLSSGFRYNNMDAKMIYRGHTLLILEGLDFYASEKEWYALKKFIASGNEVILFCNQLDSKIAEELDCYEETGTYGDLYGQDKASGDNKNILTLTDSPQKKYGYKGRPIKGYFITKEKLLHNPGSKDGTDAVPDTDTSTAFIDSDNAVGNIKETDTVYFHTPQYILGYATGQPDFIRYGIGDGHLTLHAAPLALSNYFLLQDGNKDYLTAIWQTLPSNISHIYWNEFYNREAESSGFDVLWRYAASKMGILLGILVLLIYILFEGKRKQRIIPIVAPLKNDSVSFVETVGRLYYNKGNHTNLAEKMAQQFLEWVRNHYFLNTNLLDEQFIQQLTIKSGQTEATARGLTDMIKEIKSGGASTDDAYLYQLYNTIHQFYKNHSH